MMKTWLKITLGVVAVPLVLGSGFVSFVALNSNGRLNQSFEVPPVSLTLQGDVQQGEHIVKVRNGCAECHGADLGGRAVMDNPAMGKIYAKNLTPAALKSWSDGEIARAIRHGIGKDNKALVLMPSHDYIYLTEQDLASSVAFLRSVPEVQKSNESTHLGPIARMLLALNKAPLLPAETINHQQAFTPEQEAKVDVPYGEYLAQTACMGCHGQSLQGGPIPGGDPSWPPASSLRKSALNTWTEANFIEAMRSGKTPAGQEMKAPMPWQLIGQYTDTELKALWQYLQTLP